MMFRILVIDDELVICQGIESMIRRMGHPQIGEIIYITDGTAIDGVVRDFKPDIVITDIRMPEISGLEVIDNIQKIDGHCKFVVLSGYDDFAYAKSAFKRGVIDYLVKPADYEELEQTLQRIVNLLDYPAQANPVEPKPAEDKGKAEEKTIIGLAKKYVKENYSKDIDMAVVSNLLSMNYFYFSKLFKEETGMNFSGYMIKVRMEEARKLLDDPTHKIYEISSRVGYDNPKNFTRVFRSFYGMSPEHYRKKQAGLIP